MSNVLALSQQIVAASCYTRRGYNDNNHMHLIRRWLEQIYKYTITGCRTKVKFSVWT